MLRALAVYGWAALLAVTASVAAAQEVSPAPPSARPPAEDGGTGSGQSSSAPSSSSAVPIAPRLAPRPAAAPKVAAAPSSFSATPFSDADLIAGKRMSEAQCAEQPSAVWVVVEGAGDCIAYYHWLGANKIAAEETARGTPAFVASREPGGPRKTPNMVQAKSVIVFLHGDVVTTNGRGEARPILSYSRQAPTKLLMDSSDWSRNLDISYVTLARPGTYGSSGNHALRRTDRELALVSAALDAIKARHNYERVHLAAYAEGAHTAAMLMTKRADLGCVVLASGLLSLKQHLAETGRAVDWTGKPSPDPSALRSRIVPSPDLRIQVLTDPDDLVFSARSQTAFVRRMEGLAVQQIFRAATDPAAHNLSAHARRVAADCAKGLTDAALRQKYENKVPAEAPDAADPPLHRPDMLRREVFITEAQCEALKTALWLTVDGRKVCIRYWMSTVGGTKTEPLVFFDGDLGSGDRERLALSPAAERISAGQLQRVAHYWSRTYGGPYVEIARIGTLGSSGSHLRDRRTLFEVRVASAALDALKEKHGWKRVHVAGQSGGGHTVAALVQKRDDIGCAVMASGAIAVKLQHRDRGAVVGDFIRSKYDPYDFIAPMRPQAGRRMIVLSDPKDTVVPLNSQAAFVSRVKSAGLPILHVLAEAGDKNSHGLAGQGLRAAGDCAKGTSDEELTKRYMAKAPAAGASVPTVDAAQ